MKQAKLPIFTRPPAGFQYTENQLDFFPHSEGHVKTTPMVNGYYYSYVYTHTDHLGNIRMKYTKHPQTGELKILEENHYYPYGLTHNGYNGEHLIFREAPGTGIQLVPVTPDHTDTHKYKFGGKEYQTEFDVNMYDFGARNYDPALGRWMNVDPLAEKYLSISPYVYAADSPIYFTDPDGMQIINGETARRERLETQNNAQKENLQEKYGGDLNMTPDDFQSDSDYNSYKASVEKYNMVSDALSESKAKEANIQTAIEDFKSTDPGNFDVANNLTYVDGNGNTQNIDIIIIEGEASDHGGAFTSVTFNSNQDGSFNSIGSITTTMDFSVVNPISNVLPHEMGHGYNAAKNPVQYRNDKGLSNCQDLTNRNSFRAKTAMDWQARYNILKLFTQNPIKF